MGITERSRIYGRIESVRGNPVLAYVTSSRPGASGQMAADAVAEVAGQLQAIPNGAKAIDLVIISNGGDPTVAWRIVTMVRERVPKFNVLIPQAAFSAATLVALGANEIVMHPFGNLGPVDPQIRVPRPGQGEQETRFGSEDLAAFLAFAKKNVGITDQGHLCSVFQKFCDQVGVVPIGVAARSAQLSLSMGEKLLRLHMNGAENGTQAKVIAERLSRDFFHHGYALGRKEAKEVGLPVAGDDETIEGLLWELWSDLQADLKIRKPFSPVELVRSGPAGAVLFGNSPANADGMYPAGGHVGPPPPTDYETTYAVVESRRKASRLVQRGSIFAGKTPDLNVQIAMVPVSSGWEDVAVPALPAAEVESKDLPSLPDKPVESVVGAAKQAAAKPPRGKRTAT